RADQAGLKKRGIIARLARLVSGQGEEKGEPLLEGAGRWRSGCAALESGRFEEAEKELAAAFAAWPSSRLYGLSLAIARAARGKWAEADELLGKIAQSWKDDPRYALALARMALRRGDLESSARELEGPALEELRRSSSSRPSVVAEQYFDVLLWKGKAREAEDFALGLAARLKPAPPATLEAHAEWLFRAGDAAFVAGDAFRARVHYENARAAGVEESRFFLRMADVHFRTGNAGLEREYREKVYGSLGGSR
ncbi:MAG TPA: tetratricopeptide repeat protein, partial [Bdellovibrionota bacterium]|nr:tetratricopeptide repeat protein [Bdellovibrionota bacterium]